MHRSRLKGTHTTRRPRLRTALALVTGLMLAVGTPATVAVAQPAADEPAAAEGQFQQVPLAKGEPEMGEPMSLAVLPDRSVLHTSRDGTLRITDQGGVTKVAGKLDVYSHDEEGLQGVGVDPDFENNRAIYLYYAPPLDTPAGDAPETGTAEDFKKFDGVNRLSRFVLNPNGTLDMASEKKVIDVAASRGTCCHVGGDIDFDARATSTCPPATTPTPSPPTATRRSTSGPTATRPSTPAAAPATPTTCAARSCASRSPRTARTPSRRATSSRRAPTRPVPRSTRWASATRSA